RTHATEVAATGLIGSTPVQRSEVVYDTGTALPTATINRIGGTEAGRVSTTSDLWGRNVTYTDTDGAVSSNEYDVKGRLSKVIDPKRTVTYSYDGTDAAGNEDRRGLGTGMTISGVGS